MLGPLHATCPFARLRAKHIPPSAIPTLTLRLHFYPPPPHSHRVTVKQDVTQDGIAAEAQIVNVDSTDSGPYFCQASNLYGRDQQLVQLQVLEPPEAPKSLTAALITSRSVNLKWQPRGSDANEVTKYIVEYMEHDGTWQEIVIADPPQYTALIENLKPATRYIFRVIAEGQAGQSAPSQELQVKTEPQRPGEFKPHALASPMRHPQVAGCSKHCSVGAKCVCVCVRV